MKYPDPETVRFVFGKKAIGKPKKYFWRTDTSFSGTSKKGDCPKDPKSYTCFDSLPEPGHEIKHKL